MMCRDQKAPAAKQYDKAGFLDQAKKMGIEVPLPRQAEIFQNYQELIAGGADFTAAETSLYLFLLRQLDQVPPLFEFDNWRVTSSKVAGQAPENVATLKMSIRGKRLHNVAEGNGPVNALDNVLRQTLASAYPQILKVRLIDYHVSIVNAQGSGSRVLVIINFSDGKKELTTMGVGEDISDASWLALLDAYIYEIIRNGH